MMKFLSGYRTIGTALLGITYAWVGLMLGYHDADLTAKLTFDGLLAIFLRLGIKKAELV